MNDKVLQIVKRDGRLLKINVQILPSSCNRTEFINSLYSYIAQKYSNTHGKYKIEDINRDLTDLLKREGII